MINSLKTNWKIYMMEAVCLGLFMASASFFATLLEHPDSAVRQALPDGVLRNVLMGIAMGVTATSIIYSPMGKLSGAHMNPAISFTFLGLGKMRRWDAIYYTIFQCAGGIIAILVMRVVLGEALGDPHVNYVVTVPGKFGVRMAFITEILIAFLMMMMVLVTTNKRGLARFTGVIAGVLVTAYVIVTGPVSGFGMNPARSLASAVPAMEFESFWIYVIAPFIGMFSAAALYEFFDGAAICAKFHHASDYNCIFNCGYCKHQHEEE